MKILAVDSSAKSASVAILENEKVLGEFYINTGFTHSQTLVPMIEHLLNETKTSVDEIDVFAANNGPGSFTGIRIGVAAVKGLALKNNVPCVGVSTLECIANNLLSLECIVCAVMDARCNQVYNANFRVNNNQIVRLCEDRAIPIENLFKELSAFNEKIVLVGDGASLCYNNGEKLKNVFIANECLLYQTARNVADIARKKFAVGSFVSARDFAPTYLRPIL